MDIRLIEEDDHHEIMKWFKAHNWPVKDFSQFPPTGAIVPGVCAGWLYFTNSPTAIMEWVVSNPKSTQRDPGLDKLISTLTEMARSQGCKNIFTATKHPKLVARLQINHNYLLADEGLVHLMKIL